MNTGTYYEILHFTLKLMLISKYYYLTYENKNKNEWLLTFNSKEISRKIIETTSSIYNNKTFGPTEVLINQKKIHINTLYKWGTTVH